MAQIYSLRSVHSKKDPIPADAVYVGRGQGSIWGNPIYLSSEDQRDWVLEQFERYARRRLEREPEWLAPLRDKDLVCWCQSPSIRNKARCHAEVLLKLVREVYGDE